MAGRGGGRQTDAQRKAVAARNARVKAAKVDRQSQLDRIAAWRSGDYPMSQWTDEEIHRERVGSAEGEFYGRGPDLNAKQRRELSAERARRAMGSFEKLLPGAVGTIADVMVIGFPADRLRAAGMVADRVLGKSRETVTIKAEDPWDTIINGVLDEERSGIDKPAPKAKTKKQ